MKKHESGTRNSSSREVSQGETARDSDSDSSFGGLGQIVMTPSPLFIRSQEAVQGRFKPLLKGRNKVYRKSISSLICRAVKGENIVTVIDGKPET
jgi:hypothetical protein